MEFFMETFRFHTREKSLYFNDSKDFLHNKSNYLNELKTYHPEILDNITSVTYGSNRAESLDWLQYFINVTCVICVNNCIFSLSWLNYVPNITILIVNINPLYEILDLSKFIYLTEISFINCQLTKLIITDLPNLISVNCRHNELHTLIIENSPKVQTVMCDHNKLAQIIGLKDLILLENLLCDDNRFITLEEIINCPLLKTLSCDRYLFHNILPQCIKHNLMRCCVYKYFVLFNCSDDNEDTCALCNDIVNNNMFRISAPCTHIFHQICLKKCAQQPLMTCPTCMRDVYFDI